MSKFTVEILLEAFQFSMTFRLSFFFMGQWNDGSNAWGRGVISQFGSMSDRTESYTYAWVSKDNSLDAPIFGFRSILNLTMKKSKKCQKWGGVKWMWRTKTNSPSHSSPRSRQVQRRRVTLLCFQPEAVPLTLASDESLDSSRSRRRSLP